MHIHHAMPILHTQLALNIHRKLAHFIIISSLHTILLSSAALVHQLETLEGVSLVLWLEELQAHISLLDRSPYTFLHGLQS